MSKRDYFTQELKNKLIEKGYSSEDIDEVIDYLKKEHYLDDKNLLERYKERAIEKGESPLKLKSKLFKKTDCEISFTYEEEYEAALNRVKKYRGKKDFKSVLKYLLNRGFNYSVSYEIAKKFVNGEI